MIDVPVNADRNEWVASTLDHDMRIQDEIIQKMHDALGDAVDRGDSAEDMMAIADQRNAEYDNLILLMNAQQIRGELFSGAVTERRRVALSFMLDALWRKWVSRKGDQ